MKKLLLLFTLFFAIKANAQIDISAIAGGSLNLFTQSSEVLNSTITPFGSLQGAYRTNKISVGLRVDILNVKASSDIGFTSIGGTSQGKHNVYFKTFSPGINFSPFFCLIKNFKKGYLSYGVNAGYMFSLSSSIDSEQAIKDENPAFFYSGKSSAFTFGIQLSYCYPISNKLSLKAEVAPKFIYSINAIGEKDTDHDFNAICIPAGVGIVVSL